MFEVLQQTYRPNSTSTLQKGTSHKVIKAPQWWFQTFFFSPLLGEMIPYSKGLKPPTRRSKPLLANFNDLGDLLLSPLWSQSAGALFAPLRKFRSQCRAQNFPLKQRWLGGKFASFTTSGWFFERTWIWNDIEDSVFSKFWKETENHRCGFHQGFCFFFYIWLGTARKWWSFRSVVVLFLRFDSWYPPWIRKPDSASAIDLQEVWQLDLIVLQILQKLQIRTTHPGLILWLGFVLDNLTNLFGGLSQKKREEGCVPNDHGPFWPTVLRLFASCKLICWSWTWRSFHYLWNENLNFSNDFFFKNLKKTKRSKLPEPVLFVFQKSIMDHGLCGGEGASWANQGDHGIIMAGGVGNTRVTRVTG